MSLPRIAVDAMGGDEGVRTMISGAALARRGHDKFKFLLVGDQARIERALEAHPNMREASEILHCEDVVGGDERPTQALRRAKTTSMGLAIQAVKNGDAGAAVSAGNTGALMAMSKLALRTMPGIDRPALAALMPSLGDTDVVMLDLGANTECDARISRAHDRELDEVARVALGVGAEVEHDHVVRLERRHQPGERGPVDARHRAQGDLAHRHQRAGVAGADRGARVAFLHRLDREAHRGLLGAAQRGGGLLVPADDILAVEDLAGFAHVGMAFERAFDARPVADQQEVESVVIPAGQGRAGDHRAHALVAAHRINGDTRQAHALSPLRSRT